MESTEQPIKNFIELLWGEFNSIRTNGYKIAPLILGFSLIEACAKLTAPKDDKYQSSRARFEWWVNKFLTDKAGQPYSTTELYSARCGLFHEYGPYSDISRKKECLPISWTIGHPELHKRAEADFVFYSRETFFEDLGGAGIKMLHEMKTDHDMRARFSKGIEFIFGAYPITKSKPQ